MHDHDHTGLMEAFREEYKELLAGSYQAMYVYLDDSDKMCNEKFAPLLGYSEDEWVTTTSPFSETFVANQSQKTLVDAYLDAMEKMIGSVNKIVWKKKGGDTVETEVILVPIVFRGHLFALHFVLDK